MSASQVAWPRGIYSTRQVREFDRIAIETIGIDSFELMQRAARAALTFIQAQWPAAAALRIYCGAGNNAGDGYLLAALAAGQGLAVEVIAVIEPAALTGDAARAMALARDRGIGIEPLVAGAAAESGDCDLVVDALLGSGLARDVEGRLAEAVARINAAAVPVLALDLPSGLDGDTGQVRGVAVRAAATVTFVGLKSGLYLGAGPDCRGRLGFADLGLPPEVWDGAAPVMQRMAPADLGVVLEPRLRSTHKGLNGRVLVVGGGIGMAGAARLAAEAALRAGAGLVQAAVDPDSVTSVMAGRPEIMCHGIRDLAEIGHLCAAADVVVVGPGLGRSRWAEKLTEAVFASDRPLVVDADALNYLAQQPRLRSNWVLTPHPGEAGRLLGWSAAAVQGGRDIAAIDLARRFGGVTVLKGACSLIAQVAENDEPSISVCDYGNPGMASGGMGDVLAGVLGGLAAQFGLTAAVCECAVLVHARAGDAAAGDGERGLLASDLFAHLRHAVNPT
jgi:NAD(P)H-hydrate epimerase